MSLTDYRKAKPRIDHLTKQWTSSVKEAHRRRLVRNINDSVVQLRTTGALEKWETWIPRRVADTNIRREQPARINYISQSRDLAKFRPTSKLTLPIEPLEREFTIAGQYPGWQMPYFQTVDGSGTHGYDAIETVFDSSKPGHFMNRHIGFEHLLFATDVTDIDEAPIVAVVYGATVPQLEEYAEDFDFSKDQVAMVAKALEAQEDKVETKVKLLKVYFKEKGTVYFAWECEHCREWLKKPEKLYLGIIEDGEKVYETSYPITVYRYDISENEKIVETTGRVFRDEHDQEAMTQATSAVVNRTILSTKILFSAEESEETGAKQTQVKIFNGAILPKGEFFNIDPPDPGLFSAIMGLLSLNANETGQVNYAVMNRKDSRKTAKEMSVAEDQAQQLNAVDVMLLSLFMQKVLTLNWRIFRSQVLQGKIESALPNWKQYYEAEYILMPSGDADVIRRQEINNAMKQDWPVISQTGAAQVFLADLMLSSPYAENAQKYIDAMAAADRKDKLLQGMANALQQLVIGPDGNPNPQAIKNAEGLKGLVAEYQAIMNPQGAGQPQEPANAEPEPEQAAA